MLKGIVLALAAFAVFLPVHVLLFRAARPHFRFRLMTRLHWTLSATILVVFALTPPDLGILPATPGRAGAVLGAVNAIVVHWFLFMGYSMFYFLVDRGFSLRIMIEIATAPGGALSAEDLAVAYPPRAVVRRRLDEMVDIGRLTRDDDRYDLTPAGRRAALVFRFVKSFLRFESRF
ncbi:MAG: hypothetical protein HY216_04865 [Candidatus Rokubacteria bacterium]|nr:hypothetical protein [Candidatus Rokubacteria bacterium]